MQSTFIAGNGAATSARRAPQAPPWRHPPRPVRSGTVSPASLWRRCLSALHNAATEVCTMRVFCADRKSRGAFTSSSACTCRAKNIIPRRRAFLSLKSNAKSPLCSPAWPRGAGSVQAACVRWAVVAMATTVWDAAGRRWTPRWPSGSEKIAPHAQLRLRFFSLTPRTQQCGQRRPASAVRRVAFT